MKIDIDALAQEIRRVDGDNSLGAGALAEAIVAFLDTTPANPAQVVIRQIVEDALNSAIPEPWEVAERATQRILAAIGAGGQAVARENVAYFTHDAWGGYWQTVKDGKPYNFRIGPHPAPSGQAVAVKPLEWNDEGWFWKAFPEIGEYRVEDQGMNWNVDRFWTSYRGEILGKFADSDDALAAAQADYERRILSAIAHPVQPGWRKPRLTESMMRAACKAHFGTENIDGVCVTVEDAGWTFREAFKRMWRGALSAAPQPKGE